MTQHDFALVFALPPGSPAPEAHLDALFQDGCDDATVGTGQKGTIGLDFSRDADTADTAIRSAVADVQRAIPGAELIQAGPDLVGLTDMASIFGFSRQNMRKYAVGHEGFPAPVHSGDPSLWHLAEVVAWLRQHTKVTPPDSTFEVAKAAARINLEAEQRRVSRIVELA